MDLKSSKDKISLNRLVYFFQHFKPEQKKLMAKPVKEFLAESPEKASRSKHLSKILDFITRNVFKPVGRFGVIILPSKQSPQALKKRREKWKPSFLLLHNAPQNFQRRCCASLNPRRRQTRKRTLRSIEDER